jgi:hypothetical protein
VYLGKGGAPAFASAGELPYAVTLRFLVNELAEARLLSLLGYSALSSVKPYCLLFVIEVT